MSDDKDGANSTYNSTDTDSTAAKLVNNCDGCAAGTPPQDIEVDLARSLAQRLEEAQKRIEYHESERENLILAANSNLDRAEAAEAKLSRIEAETVEVLRRCEVALTDWLRYYAPDQFERARVEETEGRVSKNGSWLAYTAGVLQAIRALDEREILKGIKDE